MYGLKDRIWPHFVCSFHLFCGDLYSTVFDWFVSVETGWSSLVKCPPVTGSSPANVLPVAILTDLSFLSNEAPIICDSHALDKFGFGVFDSNSSAVSQAQLVPEVLLTSSINFGSLWYHRRRGLRQRLQRVSNLGSFL